MTCEHCGSEVMWEERDHFGVEWLCPSCSRRYPDRPLDPRELEALMAERGKGKGSSRRASRQGMVL